METLIDVIASGLAAVLRALGYGRSSLRRGIREQLELLEAMQKVPQLGEATPVYNALCGHVALDIFRLMGGKVPGERKPPNWSSVIIGLCGAGGFAYWTYTLTETGFSGWAIGTGALAAIFFLGGSANLSPGRVTAEELQAAASVQAAAEQAPAEGVTRPGTSA